MEPTTPLQFFHRMIKQHGYPHRLARVVTLAWFCTTDDYMRRLRRDKYFSKQSEANYYG